jgi:hypothetical protein
MRAIRGEMASLAFNPPFTIRFHHHPDDIWRKREMTKPFLPVLGYRARGLFAMVAEMNKLENAARLAMGDHGSDLVVKSVGHGISTMVKISFLLATVALTGLIAASLF